MRRLSKKHHFTLMETMVAATILGLAVASTMAVLGGARSTLLRAENRWARQHILAQAAELYLLGGVNVQMPKGTLPDGYSSSCELYQVEDVHEEALEPIGNWILCEYRIVVYDRGGKAMAETKVQKVLKEEDLE